MMLVLRLAYDSGHKLGQQYTGPILESKSKQLANHENTRKSITKNLLIQYSNTITGEDPIIPLWKLEMEFNAGFMRGLNYPTEYKIYMAIPYT